VDFKVGLLCLVLMCLALTGCIQTATTAPNTSTVPPASPGIPSPSPSPEPPTSTQEPPVVTATPTELVGPPVPTPEPILPPVSAAPPVSGPVTITYIQMIDAFNGWGLGSSSARVDQVLRTVDGGQSWKMVTPPELAPDSPDSAKIGRLVALNPSTAWVTYQFERVFSIPEEARVWTTSDGGVTWQPSRPLPVPGSFEFYDLSDFQYTEDGFGWLIAHIGAGMNHDYMALYQGSPDGIDWEKVVDPFETPFIQGCRKTGLDFFNQSIGWLGVDCQGVRDGAFFHETLDGGRTWTERLLSPPPQAEDLFERAFCGVYDPYILSESVGVIVLRCLQDDFTTQENYLYKTTSAGESWEVVSFPGGDLDIISDELAWAFSREVHQSVDQGSSWTLAKLVNWDGQFSFVDSMNGWAIAEAEDAIALVRTIDGGQTWEIIDPQIINLAPE